jgi:choline kinase
MFFSVNGAEIFVKKVEELMRQGDGLKRWYLSAIDELAQAGTVGISSIHGLSWCEVDDPVDLAYAETVVKTWPDRASVKQSEYIETGLHAFLEK